MRRKLFLIAMLILPLCLTVAPSTALTNSFRIIDAGTNGNDEAWVTIDNSYNHPINLEIEFKNGNYITQNSNIRFPADSRETVFLNWNGVNFDRIKATYRNWRTGRVILTRELIVR